MDATLSKQIIEKFEERVSLLTEVFELAQRQHRCIEEGRASRLDRLVKRRDHALRQWEHLEDALGKVLEGAAPDTLDVQHKQRLVELIARSDELIDALKREDTLIADAVGRRRASIEQELETIRTGRKTLQAYAGNLPNRPKRGLDRNV